MGKMQRNWMLKQVVHIDTTWLERVKHINLKSGMEVKFHIFLNSALD
jgi:hypothetical protein